MIGKHTHVEGCSLCCARPSPDTGLRDALLERARDQSELREFVFDILHRNTCDDGEPHPWTDHLPWDDPEDEPNSIALADELIAALGSVSPDVNRLALALHEQRKTGRLTGCGWRFASVVDGEVLCPCPADAYALAHRYSALAFEDPDPTGQGQSG